MECPGQNQVAGRSYLASRVFNLGTRTAPATLRREGLDGGPRPAPGSGKLAPGQQGVQPGHAHLTGEHAPGDVVRGALTAVGPQPSADGVDVDAERYEDPLGHVRSSSLASGPPKGGSVRHRYGASRASSTSTPLDSSAASSIRAWNNGTAPRFSAPAATRSTAPPLP